MSDYHNYVITVLVMVGAWGLLLLLFIGWWWVQAAERKAQHEEIMRMAKEDENNAKV